MSRHSPQHNCVHCDGGGCSACGRTGICGIRRVEIGNAVLYRADSTDLVHLLPLKASIVADPPYGISYSHGEGGGVLARATKFDDHAIVGDDKPFDPRPWLPFREVVLFGANHFASRLPDSAFWLIWDKRDAVCSNDQADAEMAWVKGKGNARIIRHLWMGMLKASERGTERVHPTQKPIVVMEWVIRTATSQGATIIDPYMGSGTTGVACARLGRPFIGIEFDEKYFEIACERIAAAQSEPTLFSLDDAGEEESGVIPLL